MKKILIIAHGDVAEKFLDRVDKTYPNDNVYDIVHYDPALAQKATGIFCRFYEFDPTSRVKLAQVATKKHVAAYIVLEDELEAVTSYKNLRLDYKELPIFILDNWGLDLGEDENLTLLDTREFLASRVFSQLPDIPVFAQQVGLGVGDITEVMVPFGSTYAYRHISNIEQKSWKIAAVYRNSQLILPKPSLMIRPNDVLLLIGQPAILKDVYKAIKIEQGQFPAPYGKNILHIVDMRHTPYEEALKEIQQVIHVGRLLKNKFTFIKVIHPDNFGIVDYARNLTAPGVYIDIVYDEYALKRDLSEDIKQYNVGLVVVNRTIFKKKKNRKILFSIKKPVLKLGEKSIADIDKSAVLLSENKNIENISSAVFDISTQLSLIMNLYNIDPEEKDKSHIIEHFENLAEIYSKDLELHESTNNPLRQMQYEENFLQFVPFEEYVVNASYMDIFFPNIDKLYQFLDEYNQIFIPVL